MAKRTPEQLVADSTLIHGLKPVEVQRLQSVLVQWPAGLIEQGIEEEIENIYAARELARLPELTLDEFILIRDNHGVQ